LAKSEDVKLELQSRATKDAVKELLDSGHKIVFPFAESASTGEFDLACFVADRKYKITKAQLLLEGTITGDGTNAFDVILNNATDTAVVARKDYDTGTDAVKHEPEDLEIVEAEAVIDEGDVLTLEKDDKGGSGTTLPAGILVLTFEPA